MTRRRAAKRLPWLLERLRKFVVVRGWWPSAPELADFAKGRAGSRWTVRRRLANLERAGLVKLEGRGYELTSDGHAYLRDRGFPPIRARLARPKTRAHKRNRAAKRLAKARRHLDAFAAFERPNLVRPPWMPDGPAKSDHGLTIVE